MNRLSTQLECSAPAPWEEPAAERMTMGTLCFSPWRKRQLATQWKISWKATLEKSAYISSTQGRRPASAAPKPTPMMAVSEMGVLWTRKLPNFYSRPRVAPKIPPN